MRKWLRYWVRGLMAGAVGLAVFGMCAASPALWDTAVLAGWDAGVITWLILTFLAITYYSFTIAMCYQTSDVTVRGSWMRLMTLLHAIVSFAFVLIILGYTVNAIGTAI